MQLIINERNSIAYRDVV